MPARSGIGSGGENDVSPFSEIMQPCSDMNKNWHINVTAHLKRYMHELESAEIQLENGGPGLNFVEAAYIIQGCASIFGKKVDYLYNLVNKLACDLANTRQATASSEGGEKVKVTAEKELFRRRTSDFVAFNDIHKANNLNINEDLNETKQNKIHKVPLIPLSLIPLDQHEKGNTILVNIKSEEIGNKKDYQLNTSSINNLGCLILWSENPDCTNDKTVVEQNPDDNHSVYSDCDNNFESEDINLPNGDTESNDLPTPMLLDGEDPLPEIPPLVEASITIEKEVGRRRSMRQMQKVQRLAEENSKKLLEAEAKSTSQDNKIAWEVQGKEVALPKRPVQKKCIKRLPKRLIAGGEEEVKESSTLEFCCKKFFGPQADILKKIGAFINKIAVNEAFEELMVGRFKEQEEALKTSRKKLKLENQEGTESKEEPTYEDVETDSPCDDDVSPDIPDISDMLPTDLETPLGPSVESSPAVPNSDAEYVNLLQKHVEDYMNHMKHFSHTDELSEKVNKWEEKIKPVLENENQREPFNIHMYGTRIIDEFEDNNRKQSIPFETVCKGKTKWEVCRYFLASLQLANNCNVEIKTSEKSNGMHKLEFTLLSRKRHQEQLDEFGHSSGEH